MFKNGLALLTFGLAALCVYTLWGVQDGQKVSFASIGEMDSLTGGDGNGYLCGNTLQGSCPCNRGTGNGICTASSGACVGKPDGTAGSYCTGDTVAYACDYTGNYNDYCQAPLHPCGDLRKGHCQGGAWEEPLGTFFGQCTGVQGCTH